MLQKLYQWNPSEHAIIEDTWGKVASTLYTRECIVGKNPRSETDGPGTGPSKHTGGSRSTDEMEARVTAAISSSSDDSQAVQELDNLPAVTAAEEHIKLLEEEMLHMRENQERIFQERVEAEVQLRVDI
ncbi:hypothetical protein RND71_029809 [Anisodus tanguticus]|uniref:Uncharacterized protein n=1 Tax=Anisodus tanguticus TaxID=243964 RepID=A0AAE1RG70_9SOLA|nr:hypothetical protein RND71_029809 [Anisodus tanguticus]